MLETGKVYKVFGNKVQKVVKVTDTHIHTTWPNGMVPARQGDRLYPIEWVGYFTPLTSDQ